MKRHILSDIHDKNLDPKKPHRLKGSRLYVPTVQSPVLPAEVLEVEELVTPTVSNEVSTSNVIEVTVTSPETEDSKEVISDGDEKEEAQPLPEKKKPKKQKNTGQTSS